jgi:hypothetical protein
MEDKQNEHRERNRYRDRIEKFGTDSNQYVEIYDPLNEDAWIRTSSPVSVEE